MNEKAPDSAPRFRQGMDYGESEEVQDVHAAIQRENANRASDSNRCRSG